MPKAKLSKVEFDYEIYGEGEPLLLIAGYLSDKTYYLPIIESLQKRFKVIVFDNQGIGQTHDNNVVLSIEDMAQNIVELMDHLRIDKLHLAGKSMGGLIAQVLAQTYPERVEKLILLTTTSCIRRSTYYLGKGLVELQQATSLDNEDYIEALLGWIMGEVVLNDDKRFALYRNGLKNRATQPIEEQYRQLNALRDFSGLGSYENITHPALIVYGDDDLLTTKEESLALASKLKNSKVVGLNTGHAMVIEEPEQLLNILFDFLTDSEACK